MDKTRTIRLGVIGNSSQVRNHYLNFLSQRAQLPCCVEIAWVAGCRCDVQTEQPGCPFRSPNVPSGLSLGTALTSCPPCVDGGNVDAWRSHVSDRSVDAVLVSVPNSAHSAPVREFLKAGIPVAVDKPPVISSKEAIELVELAKRKQIPLVTLAQRRFEDVYALMAEKIPELGTIQLITLTFVHGWVPQAWRARRSLAGGGVMIDSLFNCLDVLLWLLRKSPRQLRPEAVHAYWDLQSPSGKDSVELRIIAGVRFNTGCLLNITGSCTALGKNSVDENLKIFGSDGVLRYQRDVVSRTNMAAGQLTFQSKKFPEISQTLMPAGQGQGLRWAPLSDFLHSICKKKPSLSPAKDSIDVLKIIEAAYKSAEKGGKSIRIP